MDHHVNKKNQTQRWSNPWITAGTQHPLNIGLCEPALRGIEEKFLISFLGSNGSRWIALWLSSQTNGQAG